MGIPEKCWRGCWQRCWQKWGCWHKCWQAGPCVLQRDNKPASTPASTPMLPAPPPALFWNSHFGVLPTLSQDHAKFSLGARLRGRTATQRSKIRVQRRFWEGFRGRGSQKGSETGAFFYGFYSKKRVLRRVLRRGSEKAVSRRCLERPLGEYAPLGVRPISM